MSSLSLPMVKLLSWSSLESVFLTRRAVRRAWGFWYQHSFMVFAMAARIYENTAASVNQTGLLMRVQAEARRKALPGGNGAGCAEWASAGRHRPPSSSPQSWDLWAPGQRREDDTLQRFLGPKKSRCSLFLWTLLCSVNGQMFIIAEEVPIRKAWIISVCKEDKSRIY